MERVSQRKCLAMGILRLTQQTQTRAQKLILICTHPPKDRCEDRRGEAKAWLTFSYQQETERYEKEPREGNSPLTHTG